MAISKADDVYALFDRILKSLDLIAGEMDRLHSDLKAECAAHEATERELDRWRGQNGGTA